VGGRSPRNAPREGVGWPPVKTTIVIQETVVIFGLIRAVVQHIPELIPVVIQLGAAIGILEVVEVFRLFGALVFFIADIVAVVIVFRAAVIIGHLVFVFRHIGTLVFEVWYAVAVGIGRRAAVELGRAGQLRAQVWEIEHAVLIGIRFGT